MRTILVGVILTVVLSLFGSAALRAAGDSTPDSYGAGMFMIAGDSPPDRN